jgi:hypothetical protein
VRLSTKLSTFGSENNPKLVPKEGDLRSYPDLKNVDKKRREE